MRQIDAASRNALVKYSGDGSTLEDSRYYARCSITQDQEKHGIDISTEEYVGEDAEVEDQDRGFCQVDREFVQDLDGPERLSRP